VVVSHADSDHAGGLLAVVKALPVGKLYSSFSFEDWLKRASLASVPAELKKTSAQAVRCARGQHWVWDDVRFQFLHPEVKQSDGASFFTNNAPRRSAKGKPSKNAQSCVLHIQGSHHSVLLPGDIGMKQEQRLLEQYAAESPESAKLNAVNPTAVAVQGLTADLVVVAHHGSDTSSSPRFVQQIRAQHAIVQVGYLNRFGHPHPVIKQRWLAAETSFWQTDRHGAILASSTSVRLSVQPYSQLRQRYWHQRLP
jgi:competence protein ComEC